MGFARLFVALALCMIFSSPLRALDAVMEENNFSYSETNGFINLWLGLGGFHNLAWEKGSPYEFSNSLAWGCGLGLRTKWGLFWLDLSIGGCGNLGSDAHIDTINGQSREFHRSVGLIQVGVDVCYFISTAENRFKIGPSVGGRLIYEEALIHPPHGSIVWEISELYLGPAFGIQTEYDINENWRVVGSLMRYNTSPRFDRAGIMILFPEPFFGDKYPPSVLRTGFGIDLWLKDGRYKSINIFFTVAAL